MKKIMIILSACLLLAACQKETKLERAFSLYQVENVVATPGDNGATVTWTTQAGKPDPESFIVAWTPDASGVEGGTKTVSSDKRELIIENLVNDCAYTFYVQARYAEGMSQ